MALAEKLRAQDPDIPFYGINYKDDASAARRFLGGYGDPYTHIGVDRVPETYVISGDGTVAFRQAGPLTQGVIEAKILPLLQGKGTPATTDQRPDGDETPSG